MKPTITLLLCTLLCSIVHNLPAQNNLVTYAGDAGKEGFYDVIQLSDGTFLVGGYTENLTWIDPSVPISEIAISGVNNGNGNNHYAVIIQFDQNLLNMLQVVHFPQGAVENVRYIKTTNVPGSTTGDIYISGDTEDTRANDGGYYIARLNNNFVNGIPSALDYTFPVWAEGYVKENHPWDVGNDGKVIYVRGQSHGYDWASMHRLDITGNREVVENFRVQWKTAGGEHYGSASSVPGGGAAAVNFSGMIFKKGNRCSFRSWTPADYNLITPDGNGGTKKGKWPLDAFFNSECVPGTGPSTGTGYTGYKHGGTTIYGPQSIVVDRRNNHFYLGMNIKSITPANLPDFEPAVLAFDNTGDLRWWSRLYHEILADGTYRISEPDQYIDGLAIDYSLPLATSELVVNARCHGNNVENLWEGNTVASNTSAAGFQNRFTGTQGNIHISWLGKLTVDNGTLNHSTYVAEYVEGTNNYGAAHPDANMDNWPNPNGGWPDLTTTRLSRNRLKVSADGSVCVTGLGRRTITTTNAYQQMPIPSTGLSGTWNQFARVYDNDLSLPKYSSLITGDWDTNSGAGGNNTELHGIWKVQNGIVVVGKHKATSGTADGMAIPISNVPSWGSNAPSDESAILAFLSATNLNNVNDGPSPVTLPVELSAFNGEWMTETTARITWTTLSETNHEKFILQRSPDGMNWKNIHEIPGNGNSAELKSYEYLDRETHLGSNYYRLKQQDWDGTYSWSNTIILERKSEDAFQVYPNPTKDEVYLQRSDANTNETIQIFNTLGKMVRNVEWNDNENTISISLKDLPKGQYILKYRNSNNYIMLVD